MTDRVALSVQEVADMLGVGRDAIYRAVERHEIPSLRVGTRICIPRTWLDSLLADAVAVTDSARAHLAPRAESVSGPAGATARSEGRHHLQGAAAPSAENRSDTCGPAGPLTKGAAG